MLFFRKGQKKYPPGFTLVNLKTAASSPAEFAAKYRDNAPFSDPELALGFAALVLWLTETMQIGCPIEHRTHSNHTARTCAIRFMQILQSSQSASSELAQVFPRIQPALELQLAQRAVDPDDPNWGAWKDSPSRAVILLCRHFAYDLCEGKGLMSNTMDSSHPLWAMIKEHSLLELLEASAAWLSQAGMDRIASMISRGQITRAAGLRDLEILPHTVEYGFSS